MVKNQKNQKTTNTTEEPTRKVITGPRTRWSYANVWEPKSYKGSEPKYSVSLIIPKDDTETIKAIKAAIKLAYEEGLPVLKGTSKKAPPLETLSVTFYDGDKYRPDDEAYENSYYVNAKNKNAPGIVDLHKQPITDRSEVYSGCYGRASITFYAYNTGMSKGIACSLNHLQKVSDGDPLGGRTSAEQDFADYFDDDDDEDDDDDDDFLG